MPRYYSPMLGRFLTPDPAGLAAASPADPQTLNRYAYVGNSPLGAIDPFGLATIHCLLAAARPGGSNDGCGSLGSPFDNCKLDGAPIGCGLGLILGTGGDGPGGPGGDGSPALSVFSVCATFACPPTVDNQNGDPMQLTPVWLPPTQVCTNVSGCGPAVPGTWQTAPLPNFGGSPRLPSFDTAGLSALVGGMAAVTRPFETAAANAAIFYTGAAQVYLGAAIAAGACADFPVDLFTCGFGFPAGTGIAIQGGATIYGSYLFFRNITIPAWETWGQP